MRWILAALVGLTMAGAAGAQTAGTYTGTDGAVREAQGTFCVPNSTGGGCPAPGATSGGAAPTAGTLIMGTDGTTARTFRTDTTGNGISVGNVASAGTDSGNPVKVGGVFNTTPPALTTGQRGDLQLDASGRVQVNVGSALTLTDGVVNSGGQFLFGTTLRSITNYPHLFNGTTWDRQRGDTVGAYMVPTPTAAAANAIAPGASAAVESGRVAKASAGNLYRVVVTTAGVAGYLMGFNATTVPADGAVTPSMCRTVAANSTLSVSYADMPARWSTGITFAFSSTGCFTKTASATAYFEWSVM